MYSGFSSVANLAILGLGILYKAIHAVSKMPKAQRVGVGISEALIRLHPKITTIGFDEGETLWQNEQFCLQKHRHPTASLLEITNHDLVSTRHIKKSSIGAGPANFRTYWA